MKHLVLSTYESKKLSTYESANMENFVSYSSNPHAAMVRAQMVVNVEVKYAHVLAQMNMQRWEIVFAPDVSSF